MFHRDPNEPIPERAPSPVIVDEVEPNQKVIISEVKDSKHFEQWTNSLYAQLAIHDEPFSQTANQVKDHHFGKHMGHKVPKGYWFRIANKQALEAMSKDTKRSDCGKFMVHDRYVYSSEWKDGQVIKPMSQSIGGVYFSFGKIELKEESKHKIMTNGETDYNVVIPYRRVFDYERGTFDDSKKITDGTPNLTGRFYELVSFPVNWQVEKCELNAIYVWRTKGPGSTRGCGPTTYAEYE